MNEADKVKIKTEIEKELYKLVCVQVKDQIRDFVMLSARRNRIPVEKDSLEYLIRTTETAIEEAFHRNAEVFANKIIANAEKYSELLDQELLLKKAEIPKDK